MGHGNTVLFSFMMGNVFNFAVNVQLGSLSLRFCNFFSSNWCNGSPMDFSESC